MPLDVNIIYFLLSFVIPIIKLSLSSVNITKRRKRKIATACRISYEGYAGKITLPEHGCLRKRLRCSERCDMATELRTERELEFIFFCIENTAKTLGVPGEHLYDKLKESGLLLDYLVANYDVLHTQGKEYIVADLIDTMKETGVSV